MAATLIGDGRVVCVTPPALNNASYSDYWLDVTLDGQSYTDLSIRYTYFQPQQLRVSQLDPAGGPGTGGTMVYVLGTGFESFGGALTRASLAVEVYRCVARCRIAALALCTVYAQYGCAVWVWSALL